MLQTALVHSASRWFLMEMLGAVAFLLAVVIRLMG